MGKLTQLGGADRSREGKLSLLGEEQIYELESITYQQKYKPNIIFFLKMNKIETMSLGHWASNRYTNKRRIEAEKLKTREI